MKVSLRADIKQLTKNLDTMAKKQVPFATAQCSPCSFSHSLKASFMRVCQPFPVLLKDSRISLSKRTVVDRFADVPDGRPPRLGRRDTNSAGSTSFAGLNDFKSFFFSSRTSPFLSVNGKRFFISFCFSWVCFTKTDDSYSLGNRWGILIHTIANLQPSASITFLTVSNFGEPSWVSAL